jgi:hypothetical protein
MSLHCTTLSVQACIVLHGSVLNPVPVRGPENGGPIWPKTTLGLPVPSANTTACILARSVIDVTEQEQRLTPPTSGNCLVHPLSSNDRELDSTTTFPTERLLVRVDTFQSIWDTQENTFRAWCILKPAATRFGHPLLIANHTRALLAISLLTIATDYRKSEKTRNLRVRPFNHSGPPATSTSLLRLLSQLLHHIPNHRGEPRPPPWLATHPLLTSTFEPALFVPVRVGVKKKSSKWPTHSRRAP